LLPWYRYTSARVCIPLGYFNFLARSVSEIWRGSKIKKAGATDPPGARSVSAQILYGVKPNLVLTLKVAIRMLSIRRGFVSITSSCWTTWTRCSQGLSATSTSSRSSTRRSGTTSELSERLPSRTNVFCLFLDEIHQRRFSSSMSRLIGLDKVTSGKPSVEIYLQVKTVTHSNICIQRFLHEV